MIIDLKLIELSIVDYCNFQCTNCASFCDVISFNSVMSIEQIHKFIHEAKQQPKRFRKIRLVGGEPTLHPNLSEVFALLKEYADFNPKCIFELVTNGIKYVDVPVWFRVENSNKKLVPQDFVPVLDVITTDKRSCGDGCFVLEMCGTGLTRHGFYPCSIAGKMDMLLGWDVGLKSLMDVTIENITKLLKKFCQYCGWRGIRDPKLLLMLKKNYGQRISPFWEKVILERNNRGLSLY